MEKSPYKAKRGKNFTKWTKHVVVVVPSANIATIFILNCIILYCTRFIGKLGVVKLDKGGGIVLHFRSQGTQNSNLSAQSTCIDGWGQIFGMVVPF